MSINIINMEINKKFTFLQITAIFKYFEPNAFKFIELIKYKRTHKRKITMIVIVMFMIYNN